MIGKRFFTFSFKILLTSAVVTLAVNTGNVYAEELKGFIIRDVQSKYTAQTDGAVTGTFNMNSIIDVKDVYGDWVLIEDDGVSGWIRNHNLFIKTKSEKLVSFGKITATILNVRQNPDLNATILGKLTMGDDVFILDISEDWYFVKNDKIEGWVFSPYVKVQLQDKKGKMTYEVKTEEVSRGGAVSRESLDTPEDPSSEEEKEIQVEVLDYKDGEYYIKDENGTFKWVDSEGVEISDSLTIENMKNERIIEIAKEYLGKPYKWGASGPYSFDCSGFTKYVLNQVGIQIPRVSRDQAKVGQAIDRNGLQAGDLVFFDTTGSMNNVISHVGIYIGNNQFIHASSSKSGKYVRISSMKEAFYNARYVTARRYR